MARRTTYAEEIREIFAAKNAAQKQKQDESYRQAVLSETIRSNKEQEQIRREDLANKLTIQGAYGSRARDKTSDLRMSLDTTERGQDRIYDVGMDRNQASRYGSDRSWEVGMDRNQATREGQLINRQNVLDRLKSSEIMHSDELALRNLLNKRNVGLGYDRNWITESLGLLDIGEKRFATEQATVRTGMQTDSQERITDKRTGSAEKIAGMQIKGRADLQDDAQSFTDVMSGKEFGRDMKKKAYDRKTQEILMDQRTSSAEKINALDNATRLTIQGMSDKTKLELQDMSLQEKREWIEAEWSRDDEKVTKGLLASGSPPVPFISKEREGDWLGVTDEDEVVDEFKAWDTSQRNPSPGKQISVYNKAIALARQKGQQNNPYTQSVIDNYLNAHENLNRSDMGELFGGSDKRVKTQNAVIRTRLKELYKAQGFTTKEVEKKLKALKDRF